VRLRGRPAQTGSRPAGRLGARHSQGGLTLIELMVAVTIVGVLVSSASVVLRRPGSTGAAAFTLDALVREAARRASAGAAVRDDVVLATGESARTRLFILPRQQNSWVIGGSGRPPRL
jgi:prepilin-type N-terminal cleavage/methylation domain-containing protein